MAILLALIAGYIDAYGFIKLKTFVSFMSGNTTQAGFSLSEHHMNIAIASFVAISSFVSGIFFGTLFSLYKWYKPKYMPFLITALLLAFNLLLSFGYKLDVIVSIGLLSLSMGFMNTIINHIGSMSINTDFVTGTLNSIAKYMAHALHETNGDARRKHLVAAARLLFIWSAFFLGAWVSVFAIGCMGVWSLGLPIILLMAAPLFIERERLL